jgi:hypothetical protein
VTAQLSPPQVFQLDVGTWPHSGTARARRVVGLAVALAACLLAAALPAAPAGAVELGISDSDAPTVLEPHWPSLGIARARVVVPYDLATTNGAAGVARRENFERYRANAAARGIGLLVVFAHSQDVLAPGTNDPVAPTADQFAAGFAAFRASYPELTTFAAWNEPNNRDTGEYALGSQPQLAAEYWLRAQAICPSCTIVAGDFAGIAGDDAYVDAYQAHLAGAGANPAVWAFHAHSDVNRYQVLGVSDASISRYYLSKLQGQWAGSRIWIDEVGARFRDASGRVWGDDSQRDATSLLLGLATLDPRIEAIYYYNFSNQCATPGGCAIQDRGLVSPTPFNGQAPAYDAANRRRTAADVIANRGPVIAPVPALPPAVVIEQPSQGAALRTPTVAFAGRAAETINTAPIVRLAVLPGAGDSESSAPVQTLDAPVAGRRWAVVTGPLADGVYTARATQAGNPGSTGVSPDVIFTVDTVAPMTEITDGPGAVSGARSQRFAFAASEPGTTFVCSRDGRRARPCTSPIELRGLGLGRHTFGVRARDAAGNVQRSPTRVAWRVVSLATASAPRLAAIGPTLSRGLPVAAACADRCRVTATLELVSPTRARLARVETRRPRAGTFGLTLRPSGAAASALGGRSRATARLTLDVRARGSKSLVVRRTVTLVRTGALRSTAARGLPVTVACTSACSARSGLWVARDVARRVRATGRAVAGGREGLPRGGRYVSLGARAATRSGAGASDLLLRVYGTPRARLPRLASAAARVTAIVGGPGTDPRALSWPLLLSR